MLFDKTKPVYGSPASSDEIRANFLALAAHHRGTAAPSSPEAGWIWWDTSVVENQKLRGYTGLAWVLLFEHMESTPVPAAAGATSFLGLTDTPDSYSGQAGKVVKVNTGATALEFGDAGGAGLAVEVVDVVYEDVNDLNWHEIALGAGVRYLLAVVGWVEASGGGTPVPETEYSLSPIRAAISAAYPGAYNSNPGDYGFAFPLNGVIPRALRLAAAFGATELKMTDPTPSTGMLVIVEGGNYEFVTGLKVESDGAYPNMKILLGSSILKPGGWTAAASVQSVAVSGLGGTPIRTSSSGSIFFKRFENFVITVGRWHFRFWCLKG